MQLQIGYKSILMIVIFIYLHIIHHTCINGKETEECMKLSNNKQKDKLLFCVIIWHSILLYCYLVGSEKIFCTCPCTYTIHYINSIIVG